MSRADAADRPPGWIRRLLASTTRHRGLSVLVAVTAVLATGLAVVPPLAIRAGLDDAVAGRTDRVGTLVLALGGSALVVFVGSFVRQFLAAKLALEVQHDLRTDVFSALQRLDGAQQASLRTGQVMSRANIDLQVVQGLLSQTPTAVGSVVLVGVSFGAMVWISPLLTTVHVVMVLGSAVVTVLSTRRLSAATWAVQHRNAVLAQIVTETVAAAYVVKGFGQERREVARFTGESEKLFAERMRVARMQSQPMATLQSLPLLAQVAILVLGGYLAVQGQITVGDFVAFAAFTATMTAPAGVLSNLVVAAQLAAPAATRVYELVDAHPTVVDRPTARDLPTGPLGVVLDGVRFGYTPGEPVLDGVSLEVAPGETVAVVGPSGSGKSTLALLLNRFYDPQSGAVRLRSGAADLDVREVTLASLRRQVGVVFEEPFLFAGTVASNIGYGHPEATPAAIEAAARAAGADFVADLPLGLDSPVGERGANLSGGQRQRVALARTLLADPSVLVLDDAISAVDAATAADIGDSLASVAAGHTTLVIAHRRATLSLASRIVVLDGGRVADVGTEAELMARCPLFVSLFGDAAGAEAGTDVERPELDAAGITPALWPDAAEPDLTTADGPEEVVLDGMPVERENARAVAALPPAVGRPAARLYAGPDPGAAPPRGLFAILRPVKALVAVSVLLMIGDAVVTSAVPVLIQRGLDDGVTPGDLGAVWMVAAVAVALIAVNWVVLFVQPRFIARTGESAMFAMRVRSFAHLHALDLPHFERQKGGGLLTRMTTDIFALADFVESGLTVALVNLLTVGVMAAAMVLIDPGLALAAFAVLPVLALATWVFRRLSATAYEQTREQVGEVNEDLQENLAGVRTNQAAGQSDEAGERFGGLSAALRRIRLKAQSYAAAYFPFVAFLGQVATTVVLVVGVQRIADQTLTAGVLTAFLLYLGLFFAPFQQLSMVFDGYQRAKVGATRIAELLAVRPGIGSRAEALPVPDRLAGDIALEGVTFRYAGAEEDATADVSLRVAAGRRVALVGETGSGKSTLVKLVARLYEATGGRVTIDGTDVRDLDLTGLRSRFAVAPQEAHLFTGTVADNIRYARPDATDAEVQQAATAVGALGAVARLSGGFRHPVGEQASGLSGGQAQLVSLARVWLADRDIVLLDEPTASLDAVSERAVLAGMDRVAADRTTFLVTHRLASAARADLVVVLDRGRVVEQGPHQELLARGGRYAELWRLDQGAAAEVEPGPPTRPGLRRLAYVSAALVQLWALVRKVLVPFAAPHATGPEARDD